MKILVLHGSMRKGNTHKLTKQIIDRLLLKPNLELVEFNISDLKPPFCVSCHACFKNGEEYCPNFEYIKDFSEALKNCDGVVLTATTYMWAINAATKNLLDHLSYNFHRPTFFGKKGMVVATSAGNGEKSVVAYLKTVLGQWGINGAITLTQNTKQRILLSEKKIAKSIDKAANKFYKQLTHKKFIKPTFKSIAVHNAFRCMSLSKFAEYEKDTEHWSKKEYNKAYPVKAGFFRYCTGAFVFSLAKVAVKVIGKKLSKQKKVEPIE